MVASAGPWDQTSWILFSNSADSLGSQYQIWIRFSACISSHFHPLNEFPPLPEMIHRALVYISDGDHLSDRMGNM